jgi:hypothetical protein
VSDRLLRFPDRTWDELEGLPQQLRNAAHKAIFHLLEEPVPADQRALHDSLNPAVSRAAMDGSLAADFCSASISR